LRDLSATNAAAKGGPTVLNRGPFL